MPGEACTGNMDTEPALSYTAILRRYNVNLYIGNVAFPMGSTLGVS